MMRKSHLCANLFRRAEEMLHCAIVLGLGTAAARKPVAMTGANAKGTSSKC